MQKGSLTDTQLLVIMSLSALLPIVGLIALCLLPGDESQTPAPVTVEKGSYEIIKCPNSAKNEYKIIFHPGSEPELPPVVQAYNYKKFEQNWRK